MWRGELPDVTIDGLECRCTCPACPEQYDVFEGDVQVGYLRLRHGGFSADVPDCGGEQVYYTEDQNGDGQFDDEERDRFLSAAVVAIRESMDREPASATTERAT